MVFSKANDSGDFFELRPRRLKRIDILLESKFINRWMKLSLVLLFLGIVDDAVEKLSFPVVKEAEEQIDAVGC